MRKALVLLSLAGMALGTAPGAIASHDDDLHSDNMSLVANFNEPLKASKSDAPTAQGPGEGTDLAFWGDLAVLGLYDPGGFRLVDISNPASPRHVGQFICPGSQSDVSIWDDLVFVSVDATRQSSECTAGSAGATDYVPGRHWEGVRVVSIKDRDNPQQLAAVDTDCGSHTHTLVPDLPRKRLLVYVLSYPISGQGVECNYATHRKISVIEVPLAKPEKAKVIGTPSVAPAIGCHDVTVLLPRDLAAAACLTESQIWDISNPEQPQVIAHIPNPPGMQIAHSSAFSHDGKKLVLGDEMGGAAFAPGCANGGRLPIAALWFYDVSNPRTPLPRSYHQIPRSLSSDLCTAHNFNAVPLPNGKDVLVGSAYEGGTWVVDFTDIANPKEIAYYVGRGEEGDSVAWSSYWYNGFIYANNNSRTRGLDVMRLRDGVVKGAQRLTRLNPQVQEFVYKK